MNFIEYELVPNTPELAADNGGAFVTCWLRDGTLEEAQNAAKLAIEESGWLILNQDECFQYELDDDDDDDETWEHYQSAMDEGSIYLYHTWAPGCNE